MKKATILIQTILLALVYNTIFAQDVTWQAFTRSNHHIDNRYSDQWWFFDMDRIVEDDHGNIWFGTNKYDGEHWQTMGDDHKKSMVYDVLYDSKGRLWVCVYTKGLFCYADGKWEIYSTDAQYKLNWPQTLFEASNGRIWIGASSGIYYFEEGSIHKSTSCGRMVTEILEDKDANIWVSSSKGVYKYNGKVWQHYSKINELDKNLCYSLTSDTLGNIIVGHYNGRMSMFKDSQWSAERKGTPSFDWIVSYPGLIIGLVPGIIAGFTLKYKTSMMLYTDSKNNIWLASYFNGIYSSDGNQWTTYKGKGSNRLFYQSFKFIEDQQNNLWVFSSKGASKYNGSTWQHFRSREIMGKNCFVVDGYCDNQGNIWVATSKGISKYMIH